GRILFKFDLPADNHITDIKNEFFKIELHENGFLAIKGVTFPEGEEYGDERVFKGKFDVIVYVDSLKDIPLEGVKLNFKVSYQICQEQPVEVCYPPDEEEIEVIITKEFSAVNSVDISKDQGQEEGFAAWVERTIKTELAKKSFLLFLMVFIGGFLTSFTPCVYPIIPIVMGYVGTRTGGSKFKGFYLSVFFVLGLAIVYSMFGIVAAMTGSMLGISFQNPIVVFAIAAIFIIMGLSLAGFFEIPVPSSISSKVQKGHKSEIIGSMIVGGVAGIIAAPCVGPVLVALLSWISQTGNVFLGFWLTFTFSLGLGVIFLLAGTFSGVISSMPKGGKWMDYVKYFFAIMLIGGGLYFLGTVISEWVNNVLWGVFLIATAVFSGIFKAIGDELKNKLYKVLLIIVFLVGTILFIRGVEQKYFPALNQIGAVSSKLPAASELDWESDLEKGKELAAKQDKLVMIDTYADWCVACKELEEQTFSSPEVITELKKFILVKLDFTEKNDENEKIRKSLKVIGMPTVIFLSSDGKEINRFSGFYKKDKFLSFLNKSVYK
ncbi:MAG: protein-disulfide reductase DsbD, partial [Candidatus Aminicenantes bacterium]|nr:protein-disulfide reductase DsbD [Candidatus Aminicenantes bacterium]